VNRRWLLGVATASAIAALLPPGAASDTALLPNPAPRKSTIKRYVLRFGPVNLGSYQVRFRTDHPKAPGVDGSLIAMNARVVDRDGKAIPPQRVMLHHVLFLNEGRFEGDRHDGVCRSIPRERFYGKGEEGQVLRLPNGYGYPLRSGDKWRLNWMLMNHKLERQEAYIEYTVVVDTAPGLTPVRPLWFDVVGCRQGSLYDVPGGGGRGSIHSKSITWKAPESGRLVAGGAHLHGGATNMVVNEPGCDSRWLFASPTLYGNPDHPYYQVRPVLHEPGPISSGWFESEKGIPITKGERLRITSKYDNSRPHMAVMGIMHAYLALGGASEAKCQPLPDDIRYSGIDGPGRRSPPKIRVPLTKIDSNGQPETIERVAGRHYRLGGGTTVDIRKFRFSKTNLSIPIGSSIVWRFDDRARHAVTLANGPLGFGSNFFRRGERYKQRFTRPGVHQIYCQLHPVTMHEIVKVRRKKRRH
jgi:plastocyanin